MQTQLSLNQSVLVKDEVSTRSIQQAVETMLRSVTEDKVSNFIYESTIPLDVCDQLIDFYHTSEEFEKRSGQISNIAGSNPDHKESIDLSIPINYAKFDQRLDNYFVLLHQSFLSFFEKYKQAELPSVISNVFNIQWYPPNGGYKIWHFERTNQKHSRKRHLVWMTYLTDNPDGGTEFYFQDLYIPAEKGKTIIWPAEWTHTHKGRVDSNLEKMIITGWMEFK